jgi:uncharacterized protein
MSQPCRFHISLRVRDLDATRRFYAQLLGCAITRDEGHWFDLDLFGHQITMHSSSAGAPATVQILDHFGPILDRLAWHALVTRVTAAGIGFALAPLVTGEGTPDERGKFVIADPDGIGLEFKYRV